MNTGFASGARIVFRLSGTGTFERSDPFTGDAVTVASAAGREDARRAVEAARDLVLRLAARETPAAAGPAHAHA